MSQQVTTSAGSTTTFVIRWVQEMQVDALVHATDNSNLLLSVTLAFLAAAAAAGITLGCRCTASASYLPNPGRLRGLRRTSRSADLARTRERSRSPRQDPGHDDGISRSVHAKHGGKCITDCHRG